jgi:hypothetical protein
MKDETAIFLAEGMKRYRQATKIMMEFFQTTQIELQEILKNKKEWGKTFIPKDIIKVKSTKYWDEYPLINAQRAGTIDGQPATIKMAINWFESDSDYPFHKVSFGNAPEKYFKNLSYDEIGKIRLAENRNGLIFNPDQTDFNLERDFNNLINEFVKAIEDNNG